MIFLSELFYNFYVSQSRGEHGKSVNYDVTSFSLCIASYSCLLITLSGYRVLLLVPGGTWLLLLRWFPWNQQLPCSRLSDRSSRPSSIERKHLKKKKNNRKKAESNPLVLVVCLPLISGTQKQGIQQKQCWTRS